jgi:putative ABC transport system ATP-binding protein
MEDAVKSEKLRVVYLKGTPAETAALNDVTITIKEGEFAIVFGPSGCGKSTLLYTISGAERRIESGELWVGGASLPDMGDEELVRFHRETIGFVFQAHNLIPTITVQENVELPLVFRGMPEVERQERALKLLERFNISELAGKLPHELSGGQQQRVGIARALANDAAILLADEPTGNLDSKSAATVMETFVELNEQMKKTIILVTHSPKHLPYATHIIHMKDGQIIKDEYQARRQYKSDELIVSEGTIPGEGGSTLHAERFMNYFGLNLNRDAYLRLEEVLRKFFERKVSKQKLFEVLDLPYKKGGVGLYKQSAKAFAQEADDMLFLSDLLRDIKTVDDLKQNIGHIITWLLHDTKATLTEDQYARLKDAMAKRIASTSGADEFEKVLDAPIETGGVGLNWRTAKNLAQKLEVVLN